MALESLLEELLNRYDNAIGVTFHSLDLPVSLSCGEQTEILEKYKDIPIMSADENFSPKFSFLITDVGSIVIFFFDQLHFVSILSKVKDPNKELASQVYQEFKDRFESAIKEQS